MALCRNVEIKLRVNWDDATIERAYRHPLYTGSHKLQQKDIFYRCSRGRLKLRTHGPTGGELIAYHRPDTDGAKESQYRLTRVDDTDSLDATLTHALGQRGSVEKTRRVYWIAAARHTRIHFDDVEGLGRFVEIEVVLKDDQTVAEGQGILMDLVSHLQLDGAPVCAVAYVDML